MEKDYKEYNVEMHAFKNGEIRKVRVPVDLSSDDDTHHNLELIYLYGQNDIQPVEDMYSVSVGDIINYNDEKYRVEMIGFKKLN